MRLGWSCGRNVPYAHAFSCMSRFFTVQRVATPMVKQRVIDNSECLLISDISGVLDLELRKEILIRHCFFGTDFVFISFTSGGLNDKIMQRSSIILLIISH